MFSSEFCEISKNTFFRDYLWATASGNSVRRKMQRMYLKAKPLTWKNKNVVKTLEFVWNLYNDRSTWNKVLKIIG